MFDLYFRSKFEKADILEQAANLLIELGKEKKRKVKEEKDTVRWSIYDYGYSIQSRIVSWQILCEKKS